MATASVDFSLGIRQLIAKAALQAATESRQPRWVQVQVLTLRHLDRDGLEAVQPRGTAQRPPARSVASEHLGLVSGPDLTHFDTGVEFRRELAHQFPEVDTPIGREIEDQARAVELLFGSREFHVEVPLADLEEGHTIRILLPLFLLQPNQDIFLSRPAKEFHRGVRWRLPSLSNRWTHANDGPDQGPGLGLHHHTVTRQERRIEPQVVEQDCLWATDWMELDRNVRRGLAGHRTPIWAAAVR
jgi:hypothetical protein